MFSVRILVQLFCLHLASAALGIFWLTDEYRIIFILFLPTDIMGSNSITLHENETVQISQSTGKPPSQEIKLIMTKLHGGKTQTIDF